MRDVSIDFEASGLDYWHEDFRVTDVAISWRDDLGEMVSKHVKGHEDVGDALRALSKRDVRIIVHGLQYETGVLASQYPDIKFKEIWCTMRLCQVGDAGSEQKLYKKRYKKQGGETKEGLSLVACCSRWLDEKYHNHKAEAESWVRENIGMNTKFGAHIKDLPEDVMKRYNCGDTENTLRLYEELIEQFKKDGYTGYITDHQLYRGRCEQLVEGFIGGVKVDRDLLQQCVQEAELQLEKMKSDFLHVHKVDITKAINIKQDAYINDPNVKTERGRESRRQKIEQGLPFGDREKICEFNIGSTKDLFLLYNGILGIKTPFLTKPDKNGNGGGNPSFKKGHLAAWHKSGKILQDRGSIRIRKKQAESLLELTKRDGRWHVGMQATGTKTGRLSGGAGERG